MPPDLLIFLCDTARADAFSPWGGPLRSPSLERLCSEGRVYSNAHSQAPWTLASTASIFSGKLPTEHGITGDCFRWVDGKPTSPAEAVKGYQGAWLPETMRERGYRTWGASCNTWVSRWGGFHRGFDDYLDLRDKTRLPHGPVGDVLRKGRRLWGKVDRGGRAAVGAFGSMVRDAPKDPLFAFVNLMECHAPYDPPRPYYPYRAWRRPKTRRLSGGRNMVRRFLSYNSRLREPTDDYTRTVRELYFRGAQYEDALLARMIAMVEERGRPAVVVVVADHGEQLGEHGMFNHNSSLHQTLVHVPLVVWGHRVDVGGGRVDDPVSLLGLADWVRGLGDDGAGAKPLSPNGAVVSEYESTLVHTGLPEDIMRAVQGKQPEEIPPMVLNAGFAARKGSLKYVAAENGYRALFDLGSDPNEERNVLSSHPSEAEEFRSLEDEWLKRRARRPRYEAGDVAAGEIEEHLRTLGYIE